MKVNQMLPCSVLALLLAACASMPEDDRTDNFGKGLPTQGTTAISEEVATGILTLNAEGLGDKDGDGVIDSRDQCDAVEDGQKIDENGCGNELSVVKTIDLTVEFASNSHEVNEKYHSEIENLAKLHNGDAKYKILIEGHTDASGARSKNMALSTERARAVGRILVDEYGVKENDVLISGFGPDQPVASNKSKAGRQKNRRMIAHLVYSDRVIEHQWNIWSVELGDKKDEIKQFYDLVDNQ